MSGRLGGIALAGSALFLLALLGAGRAGAEQTGGGGVVVSLDGRVSPDRLPRQRPVPVSVTLSGAIRSSDGTQPPRLAEIELAFGARGGLETKGLPSCPLGRLRNATRRQALARCSGALVGRGTIETEVPLDPSRPLLARAGVLAFNGRSGGRPAVWLHAYSASPPVSFVLPFYLSRIPTGAYGLLLRAPVASALGRWPRLRSFEVTLGRRYRAGGAWRSYLNARCPLPPRFNVYPFPLARATYRFSPGPTHSVTHVSSCGVRE